MVAVVNTLDLMLLGVCNSPGELIVEREMKMVYHYVRQAEGGGHSSCSGCELLKHSLLLTSANLTVEFVADGHCPLFLTEVACSMPSSTLKFHVSLHSWRF